MLPSGIRTLCVVSEVIPGWDLYFSRSCTASPDGRLDYLDDLHDVYDLSDVSFSLSSKTWAK